MISDIKKIILLFRIYTGKTPIFSDRKYISRRSGTLYFTGSFRMRIIACRIGYLTFCMRIKTGSLARSCGVTVRMRNGAFAYRADCSLKLRRILALAVFPWCRAFRAFYSRIQVVQRRRCRQRHIFELFRRSDVEVHYS